MSRFELEYLISLRGDAIVESLSLMMGLQLAIFVAIYYLKGLGDLRVRHAIFSLYSLALITTLAKCLMDLSVVAAYTNEILALFPIVHEERIGVMRLPQYTREAFTIGLGLLYALLWAATFYFLYFHRFILPEQEAAGRERPLSGGD